MILTNNAIVYRNSFTGYITVQTHPATYKTHTAVYIYMVNHNIHHRSGLWGTNRDQMESRPHIDGDLLIDATCTIDNLI